MSTPKQRTHGLSTRTAGDDVLVHDTVTDEVHCLTGELAEVWQALRLGLTEPELAVATQTDPARLAALLADLQTAGLLAEPNDGIDRRALLQRAGIIGAGAVAFPLLTTAVVPRAAAAATADSNVAPVNSPASAGQTLPAGSYFTVVMVGGGGGGGTGSTAGGAGARYQLTGVVGSSDVTITALTPGSGGSPTGTGGAGAATGGAGGGSNSGGGGGASSLTLGGVVVAIAGGGGGGSGPPFGSVNAPTAGATPTMASGSAIAAVPGASGTGSGNGGGGAGSTAGSAGSMGTNAEAGGSAFYNSGVTFMTPTNYTTTLGAGGSVGNTGGDGLVSITRTA